MIRLLLAYAAAVIATAVLGSVAQTQFNLAFLAGLGVDVPLGTRLATTGADLLGFAPRYGAIVAVAFAIAFAVAELIARRFAALSAALFAAAGAAAIVAVILLINAALTMTPVAATRTPAGLAALALGGAVGGFVYHALRRAPPARAGGDI